MNKKRRKKRAKLMQKFKGCVWVVIALKRMQRYLELNCNKPGQRGILRYCEKAVNLKNTIDNYSAFSDKILEEAINS